MPDRKDDSALLLAAACVPLPEAMIFMLCQPEEPAPGLPANDPLLGDPPVTDRQRWILNLIIIAGALAVAAAAIVARLAPPG